MAALDARPEVGVASVSQRATDGELLASIRRFPTPARDFGEAIGAAGGRLERSGARQRLRRLHDRAVRDWLVGAFLIARREAVAQVGPLDERFFLYAEETDWCLRFRAAGWDVRHLPLMTITHHEGDSTRPEAVAQLGHSRRRYAYKHFAWPRAAAIHASLVLGHLLRLIAVAPAAARAARPAPAARAEASGLAVLCGASPP